MSEAEGFTFTGSDTYKIQFMRNKSPHLIRIVVDGYISKENINLLHPKEKGGYKDKVLKAISQKFNGELDKTTSKLLTQNLVFQLYSKTVKRPFTKHQ